MEFARPWFLLLLLVLPLLALPLRRSLVEMTGAQCIICLLMRGLVLALLVLALAGPRISKTIRDLGVVFLVDGSASVSQKAADAAQAFLDASLKARPSSASGSVVGFAAQSEVWRKNLAEQSEEPFPKIADRAATNVGDALTFAQAILPADKVGRVVLLSDGNDTGGEAMQAAEKLRRAGVSVFTIPLRNPAAPEVLVSALESPRVVKSGEPFDLTADVQSNVATHATVKLYENQFLLRTEERDLPKGRSQIRFQNITGEGSSAAFEVEVIPRDDTSLKNNRAQAVVTVNGQPKVLIIDPDPSKMQALAGILRSANISTDIEKPAALPQSLADLQPYDVFILSDVPSLSLTAEQMQLYQTWVKNDGGSFAMLGGENSFGVGGYYKTPIEQMLPVRMDHDDRQETPNVALLVVLDRSGSMSASAAGTTKIALADQGAVYAMDVLQSRDLFGVTAVDTVVHSVAPLAPLTDKPGVQAKVMEINAGGGGIYIYTALLDAFQTLRDAPAKIKHVILFSDAADAEEKASGEMPDGTPGGSSALDLVSSMLGSRITTSVVGLGTETDRDTAFLRQLAERGSGRFYLTSDATTLPQIFTTETMKVSQSSLNEEPFQAVPSSASGLRSGSIISGIDWTQAPLLLGCNTTKPKPGADLLLATERGEPLLAVWRYGIGQAAAFTSDAKPRWASEWITWPGFGKFWTQLIRGLVRKAGASTFQVTTSEQGNTLTLAIDALTPAGEFLDGLPVSVHAIGEKRRDETQTAKQTAPGHYVANFALPERGTLSFAVSSPQVQDGDYRFSYTRSYPAEFLSSTTNEALLKQIATTTDGVFDPRPEQIFAPPAQPFIRRVDIAPWLLMAALTLFPVDIWLRRRAWKS